MEFPSSDGESEWSKKMKGELLDLLVQNTKSPEERRDPTEYERMLKLYGDGLSLAAASPSIDMNAVQFHEVVIEALRLCAQGWPLATRQKVRAGLVAKREQNQRARPSNLAVDQAIDFGLRTWLMFDCSLLGTVGKAWRWPEHMSICAFVEEFVNGCFSPESSSRDQTTKKFPRKFTARNIYEIAGIKIRWTDFLSDHLAFSEEGGHNGTLSIFRQKRWLLEMEKLSSLAASNDQIGSVDADEPQYHGAIPNSGTAPDAGPVAAESGKDQEPELLKTNYEPSSKSIAKNEDAAVVPTSTASETNGSAKRDDTLKQEDECNQDGNENPEGVPKQDATPKQDDTPKQGEPPRQETPKPIMMPACPLPHQLIQETLRSLDLLCPTGDPDSVKWLDEADIDIASEFFVFRHPLNAPRLREFTYLRERLLDLIEEYEAPPRHWRNVYKDRRNPTTFWTFWIGVVILLLTFIAIFLAGFTYEKTP